jgi:CRISPR-associated exonuclease Cas4
MSAVANAPLPLRVHDLKQWTYCPRIVFYSYVMPVDKKRTYKMQYGRSAEEAIDRLEKRRKLTEFGLAEGRRQFHVRFSSCRLGLVGRLDLLVDSPTGLFPVDFKASERRVHANHVVQLSGYALLLEERVQRIVERGFIFLIPIEKIVPVEITPERKQDARTLIDEIRSAIVRGATPPATEVRARCENCEYRNYCGDIF